MSDDKKQCIYCHIPLRLVSLSDLVGEEGVQGLNAEPPPTESVFSLFEFYVCAKCGHTALYAGGAAKEVAAKKQADYDDGLIGIS